MTSPDPGRETQIVPVHGRNVVIRQLIDAQLMLLNRGARLLQRDDVDKANKLATVDCMFTILKSVIVQPDDKEFLEDLMAEGKLGLRDLMGFISAFDEDQTEEKPKVRRGRPRIKRA